MTDPGSTPDDHDPPREPGRTVVADFVDIAMLVLAVFSVGLLGYAMFFEPRLFNAAWLIILDTAICGVFLIEFLWRWRKTGWQRRYPFTHFYEILGMVPLAHPALRGFRLLRIIVVLVRLGRAVERVLRNRVTYNLVARLSEPIVLAIKKPVTIAVLDEVVKVLATGNYPQNLARSLRENSDELQALVAEKLNQDPTAGRLKLMPFHDQIVRTVIDTSMRVVLEVLADPRIDEFFADVVRENQAQIRHAVAQGLHEQRVEA